MTELINKIQEMGASAVAVISTGVIPFEPELIDLCKMNTCGNYGKNWCCPPLVGETDKLIKQAQTFKNILVFQKIYPLEDSFDFEGMTESNRNFRQFVQEAAEVCKKELPNMIMLSAGGCKMCETCAAEINAPCINPEKAYSSLEAYGIFVSKLAGECGMNYINGQNTVTYFGGVLY